MNRVNNHGTHKTSNVIKGRKDIRVSNARNKRRTLKAIRYFDALANEQNKTNADLFTEMVETYSQTTKHQPDRKYFKRIKG